MLEGFSRPHGYHRMHRPGCPILSPHVIGWTPSVNGPQHPDRGACSTPDRTRPTLGLQAQCALDCAEKGYFVVLPWSNWRASHTFENIGAAPVTIAVRPEVNPGSSFQDRIDDTPGELVLGPGDKVALRCDRPGFWVRS